MQQDPISVFGVAVPINGVYHAPPRGQEAVTPRPRRGAAGIMLWIALEGDDAKEWRKGLLKEMSSFSQGAVGRACNAPHHLR